MTPADARTPRSEPVEPGAPTVPSPETTAPPAGPAGHAAPANATLRARGLHIRHRKAEHDAVRDLDLSVHDGEILALVGPNGSGKSTALAALGRGIVARAGAVLLGDADVWRRSARAFAGAVARLPQLPEAPEGLAVRELVASGRHVHTPWLGTLGRADHLAVREALQAVDAGDLRGRKLETLSGGERRRAWLAMVLCQQAPVLLLDEPTAALDLRHQHELLALLRDLNRTRGVTMVVVLHDLEHAARLADRVAVLQRGRLYDVGPPAACITPAMLRDVFGVEARIGTEEGRLRIVVLGPADPARHL
jgi:iron complex transport system ATP-binding protein